jgi:quercetin dioxygenase-like cupin family protein
MSRRPDPAPLVTVNLAGIDVSGADGGVWSLPHDGDLDANLVKLAPGGQIPEHRNAEVDVVVVVVSGSGHLLVDGASVVLRPHHLARIPKGARRSVAAGPAGVVYLTVHRARAGLRVGSRGDRPTD